MHSEIDNNIDCSQLSQEKISRQIESFEGSLVKLVSTKLLVDMEDIATNDPNHGEKLGQAVKERQDTLGGVEILINKMKETQTPPTPKQVEEVALALKSLEILTSPNASIMAERANNFIDSIKKNASPASSEHEQLSCSELSQENITRQIDSYENSLNKLTNTSFLETLTDLRPTSPKHGEFLSKAISLRNNSLAENKKTIQEMRDSQTVPTHDQIKKVNNDIKIMEVLSAPDATTMVKRYNDFKALKPPVIPKK